LRDRTEDIPELVEHFTSKFTGDSGRGKLSIATEAMRYLEAYRWPGNVRELENTIERAVAFESTDTIQPERLPQKILNYSPAEVTEAMRFPESGFDLSTYLAELEKSYLIEALRRTRGNQTRSAELLRMSVRSFRHLLDKYGIRELTGPLRER
jgi:two-component system response regulator PilR (NtrC family)